nr:MAG TPA: hypothetical protein [Caudoviricetes sp.]
MIEENVFGGNDMRYETYSGQYKILETETIYLFNKDDKLEIHIPANDKLNFIIECEFDDKAEDQGLSTEVSNNRIRFLCKKFSKYGTGTNEPMEIAISNGKKMYIHFWSSMPTDTVRKVEYTIMIER